MGTTNIKTNWTEAQSISGFDDAALADAGSTDGDIDLAANGWDRVDVQIAVTFGASPNGPVNIEVLSSSNSGTKKDTIPIFPLEVTEQTSQEVVVTLPGITGPFANIKATNNDDGSETVNISALYAGRSWQQTDA